MRASRYLAFHGSVKSVPKFQCGSNLSGTELELWNREVYRRKISKKYLFMRVVGSSFSARFQSGSSFIFQVFADFAL